MHKKIILLVKENNEAATKSRVEEFLKEYENDVLDWYVIGGRWSGTLNKNYKKFYEIAKEKEIPISMYNDIENPEVQQQLQTIWEELGEKSINPISRDSFLAYSNKVFAKGEDPNDDIMKLSDCIEIVKDYHYDYIEKGKSELEDAEKYLQRKNDKGEIYDDWRMYGYCIKIAGNIFQQNFCFDCNVFNIEKYDYSIPEDIENYYAVMINIHN